MKNEDLLVEVEDLLRTMPPRDTLASQGDEQLAWLGRAGAVIRELGPKFEIDFSMSISRLHAYRSPDAHRGAAEIVMLLKRAEYQLRLDTVGPRSSVAASGNVFDYFDEIRKIIELASSDILFVDPYLDAEFVSRYLPHVKAGVSIRLLGRELIASLAPAAKLYAQQNGRKVEVKSAGGFHDRFIFIDKQAGYLSGGSFKDGPRKAPSTITQVTDAITSTLAIYEGIWNGGTVR